MENQSEDGYIVVYDLLTEKSPREIMFDIYHYLGELPIDGGWGYTQDDAVIIDMNDPIVDRNIPFDGIGMEYVFAKHRTYLELITVREKEDRFSDIQFETIRQEFIHGDNGEKFDRLLLKISALRSQDYQMLKERWESNISNEHFDQNAHWEEDAKLRMHIEREFWFEISSFYGKNFSISYEE